MYLWSWWFALLSSVVPLVGAVLVNVTLDDTFGDVSGAGGKIQYTSITSAGMLQPFTAKSPCPNCPPIDPSQMVNGTYHFGTSNFSQESQIILTWSGVAIYVYFALVKGTPFSTDLTFSLDNRTVGNFRFSQTSPSAKQSLSNGTVLYNQLVFSRTNLTNGPHGLWIGSNNPNGELVVEMFDYAVYTMESNNTSASTAPGPSSTRLAPNANQTTQETGSTIRNEKAVIIGASVGGAVFLVLLALIAILCCSCRRKDSAGKPPTQTSRAAGSINPNPNPNHRRSATFRSYSSNLHYEPYAYDPRSAAGSPHAPPLDLAQRLSMMPLSTNPLLYDYTRGGSPSTSVRPIPSTSSSSDEQMYEHGNGESFLQLRTPVSSYTGPKVL